MEKTEIEALAVALIEAYWNRETYVWDSDMVLRKIDVPATRRNKTRWANDAIFELTYERPEDLWPIILEILQRTDDEHVLGRLAAGPLENCLATCGAQVIEAVEARAASDEKFKWLLGGVWQNSMSQEVWARVCKCRGKPW